MAAFSCLIHPCIRRPQAPCLCAYVKAAHPGGILQLFYRVHVLVFPIFMMCAVSHAPNTVTWVMPGVLLYLVDCTIRSWQVTSSL